MKALVVNNDSDTWLELCDAVRHVGFQTMPIHHSNIHKVDPKKFDLIVLSGGWWYDDPVELLRNYAEELRVILDSNVPILGICIGMQLMHVALEQAVPLMNEPQSGDRGIELTERGQELLDLSKVIIVHKNHTRAVVEADPSFEVLASSRSGVEIMQHRTRPLLGVQFHPEVGSVGRRYSLMKKLTDHALSLNTTNPEVAS